MFNVLWKGVYLCTCRNLGEVCVVIAHEMAYGYKFADFYYYVSKED